MAVRVVPPPALKSLTVRLIAPAYTGLPAQILAPGLTQLRALEGTRLELEGVANKPLAHAELRMGDNPAGERRWRSIERGPDSRRRCPSRGTSASGLT